MIYRSKMRAGQARQARRLNGWAAGAFVVVFCTGAFRLRAQTPEAPTCPDRSVRVTLFAAEPDIVTPIGATVDARGRLLVIESSTHFRPKKYAGPPTDRIRLLQDTTGSGRADRI